MENEKILDYQQFYDELVDQEFLSARIDYQWTDNNEDFMREVLFLVYMTYTKLKDESLINPLLKLYSDIILTANTHYNNEQGYL